MVQPMETDDEVLFCRPDLVWLFWLRLALAGESHVRVVANRWLPPGVQGVRCNLTKIQAFVSGRPIRFTDES